MYVARVQNEGALDTGRKCPERRRAFPSMLLRSRRELPSRHVATLRGDTQESKDEFHRALPADLKTVAKQSTTNTLPVPETPAPRKELTFERNQASPKTFKRKYHLVKY